ncbi:MAG: transcription termination factor NusA [Propionibacteriaceae bacterium]|jgi:N utilization substance protein A|nr:transcription termination factor NusA [Propionibacteriaceae bacterium]
MDIDLAALRQLEQERGIKADVVIGAIEEALWNAYEKTPDHVPGGRVAFDRKSGKVAVLVPQLDEAGEVVGEYDDTPTGFGRVAATTARQIIVQRIRAAEDEQKYGHFASERGDIVLGTIQQDRDSRTVRVDLGSVEAIMPQAEQVPTEDYRHGRKLRVYVTDVRKELRGLQVVVSRTHHGLVEKLFALEVPEIAQGIVEIKSIARQPGHRTKIAVWSNSPEVSAKGACIGPMGQRVRAVMHELDEEKIDIIDWSPNPAEFIANSLSPARVIRVDLVDQTIKQAQAIVPDYQLSLAIGRGGQNSDLAVRLTGWRIQAIADTAGSDAPAADRGRGQDASSADRARGSGDSERRRS